MNVNGYTSQLIGPFEENEELFEKINDNAIEEVAYVNHLGIQTDVSNYVYINGEKYEIGKTGIYEIGNAKVTSLYFAQNVDNNTIIDYTVVLDK